MRSSLRFLFCIACLASGQTNRGTLTGSVTDPSGALVPGVRVTIRHAGTGAVYQAVSNEAGQYHQPNLPVGAYALTFEREGFKRLVRGGVTLGVTDVLRVDAKIEVGAVTEAIEVTAEVPRLETDTPQVGTTLSARSLIELPLSFASGRRAESFAFSVTPGVSGTGYTSHINGSTGFSKEMLVDGASVTVNQSGDVNAGMVSLEALEEVKIQTSGLAAEFGRTQGGVFNFVMKSGANTPHGSAYFGLRNEALNANTFQDNFRGAGRAQDRKQNYAASFGAPVIIPKLYNGRDRTFFFAAYERYKERNYGFSAPNRNAPAPEFYEGDFSRLLGRVLPYTDALGNPVMQGAIYDPLTFRRTPDGKWAGDMFYQNRIPVARFSQVSQKLNAIAKAHYLPTVRDASGRVPLTNNSFMPRAGAPEWDHHPFTVKVDHSFSEKHKLSGSAHYRIAPRLILDAGGLWDPNDPEGGPLAKARRRDDTGGFARLAHDWTVSPRVLHHLTLSYNRRGNPQTALQAGRDGARELGIKNLSTRGFPEVVWGGGPFVTLENPGFTTDSFRADASWGLLDSVTFSRGRHFIKTGFDLRRNHQNIRGSTGGSFTFEALATAIPGESFSGNLTGYSFASYLLGIVDRASLADSSPLGGRRHYYALFIQDDFKVSSRLTLNLGLRWEFQSPAFEVANRLSSWNPGKTDPATGLKGAYDFAGECRECTGRRYFGGRSFKDFGPRVGFAWRPLEKWSVRGAYGIVYEADSFNGYNGTPLGKATSTAWGGTYRLGSNPVERWAGIFNWDQGFPTDRYSPAGFDPSWGNTTRPGMIDPDYGRTPYIQQWNLNIQRELFHKILLDAGYLGNKGTRLRVGELQRINQLPPSVLQEYGTRLNNQVQSAADAARAGIPYPFPGFRGTVARALRPYPQVNSNDTINVYGAPLGFSTHHALQITLNRELRRGLTVYGNYTWSKTLSNVESSLIGDNGSRPLDYYNLKLEKAVASYDAPHMFKLYFAYELPFGGGHAWWGGWSITGILNYFSGEPLGFTGSSPLVGAWNGAVNRANVAAGDLRMAGFDKSRFELSTPASPKNSYLNNALFANPAPLTLGAGARRYSQVRDFGTVNEDIGFEKTHRIAEKVRFRLRAELLNAFNRHQLSGIRTNVTQPDFGQVTSVSGNRQVQLSARLDF